MEAVGLVASIAQLIHVTLETIKYLTSVKNASEDRSRLLQETTSLLPLFVKLQGQVEEAKTDKSVQWFDGVRSLAIENGPLDQLRAALEQLAKRLKPKTGLKNVAHAFVWTFDKDDCETLLARIERAKSAINLALLGDTLYVGLCSLSTFATCSRGRSLNILSQSQIRERISDND